MSVLWGLLWVLWCELIRYLVFLVKMGSYWRRLEVLDSQKVDCRRLLWWNVLWKNDIFRWIERCNGRSMCLNQRKLSGNCAFLQGFHTTNLGEHLVFYAVVLHKKGSFSLRISSVKPHRHSPNIEGKNMWKQETADLVTFTEEILDGKLHFLCSVGSTAPSRAIGIN